MCGFSAIMLKHCRRETAIQVGRSSRRDPCTIKRKRAWLVKNKLVQVQSHLGKVEAREVGINALAKAKEAVKEGRQLPSFTASPEAAKNCTSIGIRMGHS